MNYFPAAIAGNDVVTHASLFEDDGLQTTLGADRCAVIAFTAVSSPQRLEIRATRNGEWKLPYDRIRVALPASEKRTLEVGSTLDTSEPRHEVGR